MWILAIFLTSFFLLELIFYFLAAPSPRHNLSLHIPFENNFGTICFVCACVLSVLRLPFAIFPYLLKFTWALTQNNQYYRHGYSAKFEVFRLVGDAINFMLVAFLLFHLYAFWLCLGLRIVVCVCILAESIRLFTEKGQIAFSGFWQYLPHRSIVGHFSPWLSTFSNNRSWFRHFFEDYIYYYSLDNEARVIYLVEIIRSRAVLKQELLAKLSYFHTFRIVLESHPLRAGRVRDVALGEVFIYGRWTNDPWLLIGLALRRSPWIFDPRFLRRPFYYRTESNRLATLLVFQNPRFSWPFTLYQFGHEIKAARFDLFYCFFRLIGINLEETVREDGTYRFEPLLDRLFKERFDFTVQKSRELWSDDEVASDVIHRLNHGEYLSLIQIANQYTYPLRYVEEILWPQISQHF